VNNTTIILNGTDLLFTFICLTHMHKEMMGKWVMSLQSEGTY